MEVEEDETACRDVNVIDNLFMEVPRVRQADNRLIVQMALSTMAYVGNTDHFFTRNGMQTELARTATGGRLYQVVFRLTPHGKNFLRLNTASRERGMKEFGAKGSKKFGPSPQPTWQGLSLCAYRPPPSSNSPIWKK